LMNH